MTTKRGGGDTPRRPTDGRTYEIGYGRPPAGRRFVKGQSGNPRGKPKKRKDLHDHIDEQLEQMVKANVGGRESKVSKKELIARQMVNEAAKGNRLMIQMLQKHQAERSRNAASAEPSTAYNPDPNGPLSEDEQAAIGMATDYMGWDQNWDEFDWGIPGPGGPRT